MNADTLALLLGVVTAAAGGFLWWYRDAEREWRRIYLRAAANVGPGNKRLRAAFTSVVRDAEFREQASEIEAKMEPMAKEVALFRELLEAQLGGLYGREAEDALARFYKLVRVGLARGSQRWRERARNWDGPPSSSEAARLTTAHAASGEEGGRAVWTLPPSNLPEPDGALIGRGEELKGLCELLTGAGERLVTVTGMGGVGKTHLCLHAARQLKRRFGGRAYWVDLAPIPAGGHELVAVRVAQTFDLGPEEGHAGAARAVAPGCDPPAEVTRPWLDSLVRHLRDERLLLYLDNFEHVGGATADVKYLLSRCKGLRVLVSSHRPLSPGHEQDYPLGRLSYPAVRYLEEARELTSYGAVRLFVERARKRLKDFRLTDENARPVALICAKLEGLPYTVEIAAAKIKHYGGSARKLCDALFDEEGYIRLDLFNNPQLDAAARHKDPRALTAWSYGLLRPEEQRVFRRLAVFQGGVPASAAEVVVTADGRGAMGAAFKERLDALIDEGLLDVKADASDGELRYSMVWMTRECALEILSASGELEATRRRHAEFFLRLAEREVSRLNGAKDEPGRRAALDAVEREQDNLRGAFDWARGADAAAAFRLALALSFYWDARGHRPQARKALDDAIPLGAAGDVPVDVRLRALDCAALLAVKQADCERAERYARELLSLSASAGDRRYEARALHRLGRSRFFRRDYDGAREALGQSYEKFLSLDDTTQLAWVKFDLGDAARDDGQLALAGDEYRKGLELLERSGAGDGQQAGTMYVNLAFVCHKLGDEEGARKYMNDAANVLRGRDYFRWYLHFQGRLDADHLDLDAAREHFRESYKIFRERNDKLGIIRTLLGFALVAAKTGDWHSAARLIGAESALREEMGLEFPPDWAEERALVETGAREDRLGPRRYKEAFEDGRAAKWEQAYAPDWHALLVEPKPVAV
ncbi:MAG: hypothetical protein LC795_08680 [Acidobacteria bacterium]|nr:hypothetical protein [Acidobacteriota bacterium]